MIRTEEKRKEAELWTVENEDQGNLASATSSQSSHPSFAWPVSLSSFIHDKKQMPAHINSGRDGLGGVTCSKSVAGSPAEKSHVGRNPGREAKKIQVSYRATYMAFDSFSGVNIEQCQIHECSGDSM